MEQEKVIKQTVTVLSRLKRMKVNSIKANLIHGEMAVLFYLKDNKQNQCTPSMISSELSVTRPTITAALNSLEKKRYIERGNLSDRRMTSIKITNEGEAFCLEKQKEFEKSILSLYDHIGEEDFTNFIRVLNKICDRVESLFDE